MSHGPDVPYDLQRSKFINLPSNKSASKDIEEVRFVDLKSGKVRTFQDPSVIDSAKQERAEEEKPAESKPKASAKKEKK